MNTKIVPSSQTSLTLQQQAMHVAGQAANHHAKTAVFDDYLSRKSDNTKRCHLAGLAVFADFLTAANIPGIDGECLQQDPQCWHGITWGMVEAFKKWMLTQGYSVATVNHRLSVVKVYAKLASKAGAIDKLEYLQIKDVSGYSGKEGKRIDKQRETTRLGHKKADHTSLSTSEAKTLKDWMVYEGEQGLRDCLLMCLLLDHGLRCGEVAILRAADFDLAAGELRFYRPKVDKQQTHRLTADTLRALRAYLNVRPTAVAGDLLLVGSLKGGQLTTLPMSDRAITKRVNYLGKQLLGIDTLSAHDCRHYWATAAAREGTDPFRLQEAGGWNSLTMPRHYVEDAKIANEGVILPR